MAALILVCAVLGGQVWGSSAETSFERAFAWEFVALASTLLITMLIYFKELIVLKTAERSYATQLAAASVAPTAPTPSIPATLPGSQIMTLTALLVVIVVVGAVAAGALCFSHYVTYQDSAEHWYVVYLFCLAAVGFGFCAVDGLVAAESANFGETDEAVASYIYASAPLAVAFVVVAVYYWLAHRLGGASHAEIRTFVAGAAAFQMIVSTVVFVVVKHRLFMRLMLIYARNTRT